jgi:hypothetical protein
MKSYSDDGVTFHGAYGKRWRGHFPMPYNRYNKTFGYKDQLDSIIKDLIVNKDDRRCVLEMWDSVVDLGRSLKDVPCNTHAYFQVASDGRLDMLVSNRSNDIIWGAYGANAVHFSYLHEFMARAIDVPQGVYRQVSANFHAYKEVFDKMVGMQEYVIHSTHKCFNPYLGCVETYPLMSTPRNVWEQDLAAYMREEIGITKYEYRDPFFPKVAIPIAKAYWAHKAGMDEVALELISTVEATDWQMACNQWIERRIQK